MFMNIIFHILVTLSRVTVLELQFFPYESNDIKREETIQGKKVRSIFLFSDVTNFDFAH